ncbi:hypothetical protein [Photobacterium carnosum]|uniref:hypothetical protein n=1 Tax=Photobacterium carnosum TaxID=2023717 RepID=UPI001E584B69|nr:hypothetical protein [Photobacterium carnosum]MCD9516980.1 hypothetical protein [Photobacterium carnosum]
MPDKQVEQAYQAQVAKINSGASILASAVISPQMDGGQIITDSASRDESIRHAVAGGTVFDATGESAGMITATAANAIRQYRAVYNEMPSAELMASMNATIENMLDSSSSNEHVRQSVLDSAGMSSSEGIILRNRQIALVVPTQLMMITNDMVTHIPANYDKAEIFRINRIANSTFGDLTAGDVIDSDFAGQYSSMDQRILIGNGDGTVVDFGLDMASAKGKAMPFVKGKVRVLVDRTPCGEDDTRGGIHGRFTDVDDEIVTITGTVNYATGIVAVRFSKAPKTGIEIHVIADISIEKDPSLIPIIDHEMLSYTLFPHESALASSNSIQSQFTGRREFNIDVHGMQLGTARNLLAADKDRKRLNDMYFYAKGEKSFSVKVPTGLAYRQHYEAVQVVLLAISTELMSRTKRSGLEGIVAGTEASRILKSVGQPHMVYAPNYRQLPQPHYVGTIFGYKLKEDPQMSNPWDALCYAKGREHGDAGYVAGDAISAVVYQHSVGRSLKHEHTLYELAYRDLHPHNGRDWFMWLKFTQ